MNDHPLTARRRASIERFEKIENRRLSRSLRSSLKQSIREGDRSKVPSFALQGKFFLNFLNLDSLFNRQLINVEYRVV